MKQVWDLLLVSASADNEVLALWFDLQRYQFVSILGIALWSCPLVSIIRFGFMYRIASAIFFEKNVLLFVKMKSLT